MVPEEHQSKIAFNRVFEEEKLDEELAKQKQLLMQLIDGWIRRFFRYCFEKY